MKGLKDNVKKESGEITWEYFLVAAIVIGIIAFAVSPTLRNIATSFLNKFTTWFDGMSNNILRTS